MNQTVVSISDICIRASQASVTTYSEPGIALLMPGEKPLLGTQAQEALRQQPTRINSRFWADLNTDVIQINNTPVRHNADLAWNQLSQIKTNMEAGTNSLSICVPSNLNQQQLQLLTGVCQSLELKVNSLINLGIAQIIGNQGADSAEGKQQEIVHLDLQLHQLVLTNYQVLDSTIEIKGQEVIQDISFLRFIDRVLNLLREKFIQSSRFDPLHSGDTEQQLFGQLVQMINKGEHKAFHVDTAQKRHKIELSSQELSGLAQEFKQELAARAPDYAKHAYTPIFSQLPGFQFSGSDISLKDTDTEQGAALLNDQHNSSQQATDAVVYIRNASLQKTTADLSRLEPEPTTADLASDTDNDLPPAKNLANALLFEHQIYQSHTYSALISAGIPEGLVSFTGQGVTDSSNRVLAVGDKVAIDSSKELIAVRLAD